MILDDWLFRVNLPLLIFVKTHISLYCKAVREYHLPIPFTQQIYKGIK